MESLRKVQVEPSKMEILNDMVSDEIERALRKDDIEAIEGIVATATAWGTQPERINLLFLYNSYTPERVEMKNITNEDIGMDIHTESANLWALEDDEKRLTLQGNYSWEQEVKYGTLLYDRNGNVEKLREKLLEEGTNDIDNLSLLYSIKREQKCKKNVFCSFFYEKNKKNSTKKCLHLLILLVIINYV